MSKTICVIAAVIALAGCASLPNERSTAGWPVKAITVPVEQTVKFAHVGHPTVTIPAGTYTFDHENKWAWYYVLPGAVIVRKDMFTYKESGGIGCVKDSGRLFMYFTPTRNNAGELVTYLAKRELGETDNVARVLTGFLTDQDVLLWKFE